MVIKPSDRWREGVADEAARLAAGTLEAERADMTQLFPESLLTATDGTLATFEAEVRAIPEPADAQVLDAVRRVVLALNGVNDAHGGAGYETGEREELCDYIDRVLTGHGVDVPALAARRGIGPHEITDAWRDW